ncbi:MAG TPA: hypothetical protein VKY45_05795, partial [Marinilabiliaceae bacterium]|nr:hypothetical protein [Marinilabiliaceae bacterium]
MTNKKKFEINHWLHITNSSSSPVPGEESEERRGQPKTKTVKSSSQDLGASDVEIIIQRLEESHTDITSDYSD